MFSNAQRQKRKRHKQKEEIQMSNKHNIFKEMRIKTESRFTWLGMANMQKMYSLQCWHVRQFKL